MSCCVYGQLLPDNLDVNNRSGKRPGYRLYVLQNDDGIELSMVHAAEDPVTSPGYQVFMTANEALALISGLEAAVAKLKPKNRKYQKKTKTTAESK